MSHYLEKINKKWTIKMRSNEDKPVFCFLEKHFNNKSIKFLDIGSGDGRFLFELKKRAVFDITSIEINKDLSDKLDQSGLNCINKDFLKNDFENNYFDLVHCSHVIEHIAFPNITLFLNELFRVTKKNSYVIIRSPLLHKFFYNDIDHVRPYPPEAIHNYFNLDQQQIKGANKIKEICRWYRRWPFIINSNNKIALYINSFFALAWVYLHFPFSRRNGYVLILQKG